MRRCDSPATSTSLGSRGGVPLLGSAAVCAGGCRANEPAVRGCVLSLLSSGIVTPCAEAAGAASEVCSLIPTSDALYEVRGVVRSNAATFEASKRARSVPAGLFEIDCKLGSAFSMDCSPAAWPTILLSLIVTIIASARGEISKLAEQ